MPATRRILWLQLLIGWLPLWALFATMIHAAHHVSVSGAAYAALRLILTAGALAFLVLRFAERYPWPAPVTPRFAATHLLAAALYSLAWMALNTVIEIAAHGRAVFGTTPGHVPFFMLGVWLYVMIAGVSYTSLATERAARAETAAAKAQLAALRAQLHPHFLFNALHTVVHLIPREPQRAADAAEKLAGLLRIAVREERDVVTLAEELAFVAQYLDIERLRFGERLVVEQPALDGVGDALVPAFSVQTLVENAVRHAAAPRVEPTRVSISAAISGATLALTVRDSVEPGTAGARNANQREPRFDAGTGLARLRERLVVLYRGRASLDVRAHATGVVATLRIPVDG